MSIGEWKVKAKVDVASVKTATRKLKNEMKQAGDSIENNIEKRGTRAGLRLKSIFGGLGGIIMGAFATIGLTTFISGVIKLGSQLEQAQISFETLLGSTEKATQHLEYIDQLATRTPFSKLGLIELNQQLLAFQFSADESLAITQVLGDSISAVGRGDEDLKGVVLAMGQIQAKGKLLTEEMLQMAERGLPVFKILEEQLGLTKDQLGDLGNQGIKSSTAINALLTGLNEKFGGAMERQSKTLGGMWSNTVDMVQIAMGKMGLGVSNLLKNSLEKVNVFLENNMSNIIEFGQDVFTIFFSTFSSIWGVLTAVFDGFNQLLIGATQTQQGTTNDSMNAWKKFFLLLSLGFQSILIMLNTFVRTAWGAIKSFDSVVGAMTDSVVFAVVAMIEGAVNAQILMINGLIIGINKLVSFVGGNSVLDPIKRFSLKSEELATKQGKSWSEVKDAFDFKGIQESNQKILGNMVNSINAFETNTVSAGKKTGSVFDKINSTLDGIKGNYGKMGGASKKAGGAAKKEAGGVKSATEKVKNEIGKLEKAYNEIEKQIEDNIKAQEKYAEDSEKYNQDILGDIRKINKELDERKKKLGEEIIELESEEKNDLASRYVQIKEKEKELIEEMFEIENKGSENEDAREEKLAKINAQIQLQKRKISEVTEKTKESTKISLQTKLDDLKLQKEKLKTTNADVDQIEKLVELEKERKGIVEETAFIEGKVSKEKLDDAQRFANLTESEQIVEETEDKKAKAQEEFDIEKEKIDSLLRINQTFLQLKQLSEQELQAFIQKESFARMSTEEQELILKLAREKMALTEQRDAIMLQQVEISNKTMELSNQTTELQLKNIDKLKKEYTSLIAKIDEVMSKQSKMGGIGSGSDSQEPGFANGGFTGSGGKNQVAGKVHKGEWVAPQWMVSELKPLFEQLEGKRQGGFGETSNTTNKTQNNTVNVGGTFDAKDFLDYANWKL